MHVCRYIQYLEHLYIQEVEHSGLPRRIIAILIRLIVARFSHFCTPI
jgi:hypothetical protein